MKDFGLQNGRRGGPFVETAVALLNHRHLPGAHAWRHHGLGMLQTELTDTLRIHIWDPRLVSKEMMWPRCVHDHRFDIHSAVVAGELVDRPHLVHCDGHRTPPEPQWTNVNVWEIQHAKVQDRLVRDGVSHATAANLFSRGSVLKLPAVVWPAGSEYFIPRRQFHTTVVEETAITVVHRSNFDDRPARILTGADVTAMALSGIVRDESQERAQLVARMLHDAALLLRG